MPNLIYDILILALLALAVWRGYRKGLVLTVLGFLAIFAALIGASILSNVLAQPVADTIFPVVENSIQDFVEEKIPDREELPLYSLVEFMEESELLAGFGKSLRQALDEGLVDRAAAAVETAAEYVALEIAKGVVFALGFVIVLIAWVFLSHALDLVAKLPVLNTLNAWGGAAVGILWGGLLLFAAAWVAVRTGLVTQSMLEGTVLLKFFCTTNPVDLFNSLFAPAAASAGAGSL